MAIIDAWHYTRLRVRYRLPEGYRLVDQEDRVMPGENNEDRMQIWSPGVPDVAPVSPPPRTS